jgi:hypothetical protein
MYCKSKIVEQVGDAVNLLVPQCHEQAVGDELDVLAHEHTVHADEHAGERVADELALDVDGVDLADVGLVELDTEQVVEEAGEVAVQALVAGDELVGEGEARHEPTLLEQKMAQKEPEKNIPSTQANATRRSPPSIQCMAHFRRCPGRDSVPRSSAPVPV